MNYSILYTEIILPAYAGMSDAEIADALNASAAARRHVSVQALYATALGNGAYGALRMVTETSDNPQARVLADTVLSLMSGLLPTIDLDSPAAQQAFGALQQAGVITQEQAGAIDALATVPGVSRATALALGTVTEAMVATARLWPEYDMLRNRLAAGYNSVVGALDASLAAGVLATWYDLVAMIEAA